MSRYVHNVLKFQSFDILASSRVQACPPHWLHLGYIFSFGSVHDRNFGRPRAARIIADAVSGQVARAWLADALGDG